MRRIFQFFAVACFCCLVLRAQDTPDSLVLEEKLANEPGNDETRAALMEAYVNAHDSIGYAQQVLWLIHNKPESQILATKGKLNPKGGPLNSLADFEQAQTEWDTQLERNPKSAPIAYNAASFLTSSDPSRAIDLLEQARKLASGHPEYAAAEGLPYLMALKHDPILTEDLANTLKVRLLTSSDAELLSEAGKVIATDAHDPELKKLGLRLMQNAVLQEYSSKNRQLRQQALESMDDSAESRIMKRTAMRIDSSLAGGKLIEKVEPAYPTLAKSGRVQGVVELHILIGPDGSVLTAETVSGPPLLVSAAKDAVLQWKYSPTLLGGMPVPVSTNVSVSFSLSQ